jgi:hypothetical protein
MSTGEDTVRRLKQTNCILEATLLLAPLPVLRRCTHFTTVNQIIWYTSTRRHFHRTGLRISQSSRNRTEQPKGKQTSNTRTGIETMYARANRSHDDCYPTKLNGRIEEGGSQGGTLGLRVSTDTAGVPAAVVDMNLAMAAAIAAAPTGDAGWRCA